MSTSSTNTRTRWLRYQALARTSSIGLASSSLAATAAAIVAVSLGLGPLPPQPAAAQQIVFDPRAVAQAVQQVRQGLSQIQQLQTQVTNQMAMLQKRDYKVLGDRAPIGPGQPGNSAQPCLAAAICAATSSAKFSDFFSMPSPTTYMVNPCTVV